LIPDLSVLWIIAFVLIMTVALDRLLLRPLTRVMREREGAVQSARELAEASRLKAQRASEELEARTRAARAELYGQMDENRRAALGRRAQIVADTRAEIERTVADAAARVAAQAAAARTELERDADALAGSIVERVLGRKAS